MTSTATYTSTSSSTSTSASQATPAADRAAYYDPDTVWHNVQRWREAVREANTHNWNRITAD